MKIVIVGGGIAGLSAAIALRKENREITLLEQSSLNKEIGATISLQPNASRIAEQTWGMKQLLADAGAMADEGFQIYNLDGKLQMSIPLKTTAKYGAERLMFHRVDLHEALKTRATSTDFPGSPVKILISSRVVSCDCEAATVELADGQILKADVVVGADGIKSVLRKEVLGKDVPAQKTGHSCYRIVVPTELLDANEEFCKVIDPRKPYTTMVMAQKTRLIMGPARGGSIYSVVAMVPDETMHENSDESNWTTSGDLQKMLSTFADFPEWAKGPLKAAKEVGLWQLRDVDVLSTWSRGRTILIGDAAHAMLPTQGQGASQTMEDAEALGAFFADVSGEPDLKEIQDAFSLVERSRKERVGIIHQYSRQVARPATDAGSNVIKMNPAEFMDYNCKYDGAKAWLQKDLSLEGLSLEEKKQGAISVVAVSA